MDSVNLLAIVFLILDKANSSKGFSGATKPFLTTFFSTFSQEILSYLLSCSPSITGTCVCGCVTNITWARALCLALLFLLKILAGNRDAFLSRKSFEEKLDLKLKMKLMWRWRWQHGRQSGGQQLWVLN